MATSTPTLTLYYAHRACSLAPRALLTHLFIPFTPIRMILSSSGPGCQSFDGTISAADYRRINSSGFVPALVIDGTDVLTEVPAILIYIATLANHQNLLGTTPLERARVVEQMTWLSGNVHGMGWAMVRRPRRFCENGRAWEGIREKGREVTKGNYREIERRLSMRKGYLDNGLTVVDFYLYVFWLWGKEQGWGMEMEFPCFAALMERLEEMEEVKMVARDEGWEV